MANSFEASSNTNSVEEGRFYTKENLVRGEMCQKHSYYFQAKENVSKNSMNIYLYDLKNG